MRARNTGEKRSAEPHASAPPNDAEPQAPPQMPVASGGPSGASPLGILLGVSVLAALGAWLLPGAKPLAVLGRFSYSQFILVLVTTGLAVGAVALRLLPARRRRYVALRVAAVALSAGFTLLVWEIVAYFLPPGRQAEYPWYILKGQGLQNAVDLPFERPARLHWRGPSRGDLAILNEDDDPYATEVTFVTDFEGFRNSQDLKTADLLFIGDSFTEAGNVQEDDTFVHQTARQLGLSARNLGRAGYGPPTELIVLKKYGLRCRPRCVIWQITESNDLTDAVAYDQWVKTGKPVGVVPQQAGQQARAEAWQSRSPSFRLFARLRTPRPFPLAGTFTDNAGRTHEVRFLSLPDSKHVPLNHPGWPVLAAALKDGAQLLQQEKIPLIVVHIPMKIRVLGGHVQMHDAEVRRTMEGDWDIKPAHSLAGYLATLCEELNVPFIDAMPALKACSAAGELVYLPFDTHLSTSGHQLVSELLADQIARSVPRP